MKIDTLIIRNFRCFGAEAETLRFENGVTALVGGNGAGKTAALQALARLFGVSSAERQIQTRDFHLKPDQTELVSGAVLSIECILSFPELDGLDEDAAADAVPDFFNHMAATGPGEPLKARIRLQAIWTDDGTPDGTVEEDIRWIGTLGDAYDWDECQRVAAVDRGTIQLVYVPATRNPADRVTDLLKGRLWRAARWSDRLSKTTERGAKLIQKRFEREEPTEFIVERLTKRWQQVHEADTDTTPMLRLVESRLDELVRRVEFAFHPDEAGRERALADLSDGQRSLFHIALTAATLETEKDALSLAAAASPFDQEKLRRAHLTILAIEEPENSLSPFFLSRIMNQARDISALNSAQVLISSHSASILSRIEPDEVRYFRLDTTSRASSVKSLTLPDDATEAGKYVRLAVRAYPELYFARFVILGEGDSERIVLPLLAEAMGIPLDPSFVPVVPLGGRHVDHFWRLLDALKIPHATLIDLDLGRSHGGASTIRATVGSLAKIGNDLSNNFDVMMGNVDLADLPGLPDKEMTDGFVDNQWMKMLRDEGIFFSDPLDLDFAMLAAFPDNYKVLDQGAHGPDGDEDALERKKAVTLKKGGNAGLYDPEWNDCFIWYPYLFLSRSKPETHLAAISRIPEADLSANAPPELCALIQHVKTKLGLENGAN